MIVELMDYKNERHPIEVPDNWNVMTIAVVSGDEIAFFDNYWKTFDPMKGERAQDFFDAVYLVFRKDYGFWCKRKDSYEVTPDMLGGL